MSDLPLCKCGCGRKVTKSENRYISGHNMRGKPGYFAGKKRSDFSGKNHPNFGKRYNHKEETKQKMRKSRTGMKYTQETKRKMSESAKIKFSERPDLRYKCGWQRFTLDRIRKEYSFLFDHEDIRENEYKELQFKCKKCKEWFTPTSSQLVERVRAIKQNIRLIHMYLYCSDDCKKNCKYYNRHSDPDEYKKLKKYRILVLSETERGLRNHKNKINNIDLLEKKEYQLDHKYSVYQGFLDKVDPHIIGHWKNLEVLTQKENRRKSYGCSIILTELKRSIGDLNEYKI